ncbi:fluoride efflux transporter CrcB [Methanopyrus kandleri]|uniref:Fluoride-specific ion channel FluC n=1 Tax=Methanopyrus kandleri (strain AV19 / DSM 6324 / JCM 9639 / NBRC 100938) TaxID=190192 RepID=FLUC_METKA|nr:fluoride efflux transporter CrcB [Methanopyrus kandleri]Q8TW26.1 RecName: Full=Fluoride-specific ion channel FluC [Methanopyrus kandleri AV19]AAM02424.1 Integral membrane protein possibly involved in chromosome condensation [Methanopyrus kandleri AV19]
MVKIGARELAAVAIGGALGAVCRYLLSGLVPQVRGFPMGTVLVNVLGSFVLGFLTWSTMLGLRLSPEVRALATVGFCGGLTTLSTMAYETVELLKASPVLSILYLTANVVLGIAAVLGGMAAAHVVWSGRA